MSNLGTNGFGVAVTTVDSAYIHAFLDDSAKCAWFAGGGTKSRYDFSLTCFHRTVLDPLPK